MKNDLGKDFTLKCFKCCISKITALHKQNKIELDSPEFCKMLSQWPASSFHGKNHDSAQVLHIFCYIKVLPLTDHGTLVPLLWQACRDVRDFHIPFLVPYLIPWTKAVIL